MKGTQVKPCKSFRSKVFLCVNIAQSRWDLILLMWLPHKSLKTHKDKMLEAFFPTIHPFIPHILVKDLTSAWQETSLSHSGKFTHLEGQKDHMLRSNPQSQNRLVDKDSPLLGLRWASMQICHPCKKAELSSQLPVHMLSHRDLNFDGTEAKTQHLYVFRETK